jgi:acetylglutamate kinase
MANQILRVFKIGGKVVEDDGQLAIFLRAFSRLEGFKILVHGGGKWVSEMCLKLGIKVNMVDGRRITDAETLEVVKMMLAGVANKNVVSKLQGYGCNAIGLTGADGNTILADKRPLKNGIDFGFVGDVKKVNNKVLQKLISSDLVPIFASMTHDGSGNLFNTNADTIASSVAIAMSEEFDVELNYCFELNGVLENISDPDSVVPEINQANYEELKNAGAINSGMIPKIDNAFDALQSGVKIVRIMNSQDIVRLSNRETQVGTIIKMK